MDGILVSQDLRALVVDGAILSAIPLARDQIQPSSLDLRLGGRVWQVRSSFLPGLTGVRRKIERLQLDAFALAVRDPVTLSCGSVYIIEVEESLALPDDLWGRANPKSSSGRLDVFVRLLTEQGFEFDTVPRGYRGPLYLEVTPQSFHIKVRRGDSLGQLRLARGTARLDAAALHQVQADSPVVISEDGVPARVSEGDRPGFELSVNIEGRRSEVVGYRALRHSPPIDLRHRGYARERNWAPIPVQRRKEWCVLEPDEFYIFATRERLCIPSGLCAELVPFDATKGELRTHYAGFIDSGFGMSPSASTGTLGFVAVPTQGARLVLEIRTRDVPFLLEPGQPLFRVELLRNGAEPDLLYGRDVPSNYQMQGLKLAKQFT